MLFKSGCQVGSKEIQEKSDLVRLALTLEEATQDESYFLIQRVVGEKGPMHVYTTYAVLHTAKLVQLNAKQLF